MRNLMPLFAFAGLLASTALFPSAGLESLCASVQLEIPQQIALERQAFEARLNIANAIPNMSLEQVKVEVSFYDDNGAAVAASSDSADTNALFFIRIDRLEAIQDVGGQGIVAAGSSAVIRWLIVPSCGAGGLTPSGLRYWVGARLSFQMGGENKTLVVQPDAIVVQPMPSLTLDHFLPRDVYGDDAFTPSIEAPVPFPLGLRVGNDGPGSAATVAIDSGAVRIVENKLGLLVGFAITGAKVNGGDARKSLRVELGDIAPGRASVAEWVMECSLSGRFQEFSARLNHADALGGAMTSLITRMRTHQLVHIVLCDRPGRDNVGDFLARDDTVLKLYESEYTDTLVEDASDRARFSVMEGSGGRETDRLEVPAGDAPVFVSKTVPDSDGRRVVSALRDDGKRLPPANVWYSKTRTNGVSPWVHQLCLFDVEGGHAYDIITDGAVWDPQPPVLAHIGDKFTFVGDPLGLGFLVEACDPNQTSPTLTVLPLPAGAAFVTSTSSNLVVGTFFWRPQAGQEGVYHVCFSASDGLLASSENIRIFVGRQGTTLDDSGLPASLVAEGARIIDVRVGATNPAATIVWESITGTFYDLYQAETSCLSSNAAWILVASNVTATGTNQQQVVPFESAPLQRFYRVVYAGFPPNENGAWGARRWRLSGARDCFAAAPFRNDRVVNGPFGFALSEEATAWASAVGMGGPELHFLDTNGFWKSFYLGPQRTWMNPDGSPATDIIPQGHAVLCRNLGAAWVAFSGEASGVASNARPFFNWNILAPGEGRPVALESFLPDARPLDQVLFTDENGMPAHLLAVAVCGTNAWLDVHKAQWTNPVFLPGQVIEYRRHPRR